MTVFLVWGRTGNGNNKGRSKDNSKGKFNGNIQSLRLRLAPAFGRVEDATRQALTRG
jgi:hypothetical protein